MVNLDVQYPCTLQLNDDGVSFSMERVFFLGLPLEFHIAEQHVVVVIEQFVERCCCVAAIWGLDLLINIFVWHHAPLLSCRCHLLRCCSVVEWKLVKTTSSKIGYAAPMMGICVSHLDGETEVSRGKTPPG